MAKGVFKRGVPEPSRMIARAIIRLVEKRGFRRVNFIYNVYENDQDYVYESDQDVYESDQDNVYDNDQAVYLRTARFLGALPHLQMLQLDGWKATGRLLQRAIAGASVTSFRELKTVIWGCDDTSPLNEVLPIIIIKRDQEFINNELRFFSMSY